MTKLFVYINGLRGPEPQLWYEVYDKVKLLKSVALEDSDERTIENLTKVYPPPEVTE